MCWSFPKVLAAFSAILLAASLLYIANGLKNNIGVEIFPFIENHPTIFSGCTLLLIGFSILILSFIKKLPD